MKKTDSLNIELVICIFKYFHSVSPIAKCTSDDQDVQLVTRNCRFGTFTSPSVGSSVLAALGNWEIGNGCLDS